MHKSEEYTKKQTFKCILIVINMLFHLGMHFLAEFYNIKIVVTIWTAGILLLLGIYFSTPTKDISGIVSALTLSLVNPCYAMIDPSSQAIAQNFNTVALFFANMMLDLDSFFNLVVVLLNLSAWSIYWLFKADQICFSGSITQESGCLDFKPIILQFTANALMALNCLAFVRFKGKVLRKYKLANDQFESDLKSQVNANKELRGTVEANDNFLSAFSHELKNPLNALLGSIELAQGEASPREHKFLLSNAEMSGQMLLNLLTNVLDSGKIQFNKLDLNYQPTNFVEYIEHFWHNTSTLIKSKGLKGSLTIKKDFPSQIVCDAHRLSQILLNLVSNALKFTEAGYIKLFFSFEVADELPQNKFTSSISNGSGLDYEEMIQCDRNDPRASIFRRNPLEVSPPSIEERSGSVPNEVFQLDFTKKYFPKHFFTPQRRAKDGYIRIEIVDTGCGMNANQLNCLFQRYSQVNQNVSKRQIGTGLGLYISRELCRLMDGDIRVASQDGAGSSFVVMIKAQGLPNKEYGIRRGARTVGVINEKLKYSRTFATEPYDKEESSPSLGCLPSLGLLKQSKKVLVAEDLVYNQEIYSRMLKKEDLEAVICRNGREAVKAFKQAPQGYFLFAILDLNMPELDGIAASEMIRQHEEANNWGKIPIFIVTGHCSLETKEMCLKATGSVIATDVLIKPLTQANITRICKIVGR